MGDIRSFWPWLPWLIVGVGLRAWDLSTRGLALADESRVLVVRTLVQPVVWLADRVAGSTADFASHMLAFMGPPAQSLGYPPDPFWGFYLLMILVAGPIGLPVYSAQLLSVVSGSVSLFLLWRLASLSGIRWLAPVSMVLLALSPYHVLYSRIGVPQATASMFLLAGLILYLGSCGISDEAQERRRLKLAGLAVGFAFLVHLVILVHIAALVMSEVCGLLGSRPVSHTRLWQRAKWFAFPAFAVLAGMELITWLVLALKWLLLPNVTWGKSYLTSLFETLFHDVSGRGTPVLAFGLSIVNDLQGLPFLIASLIGVMMCVRLFSSVFHRTILLQAAIPFVLLSVNGLQVPRAFAPEIPFYCMLAGIGILSSVDILDGWRPMAPATLRPIAMSLLVATVVAWSLPALIDVATFRSGYKMAAEYLRSRGAERHISTQRAGTGVYLGIPAAISPPPDDVHDVRPIIELAARWNIRYVVVDYAKETQFPSIGRLKETCDPVWSVPNPVGDLWPLVADEYATKEWIAYAWASPRRAYIDVYDLKNCLTEERAKTAAGGIH